MWIHSILGFEGKREREEKGDKIEDLIKSLEIAIKVFQYLTIDVLIASS